MMAIFWWELAQRRKSLFWWTVGTALTAALLLALFPSIRDQAKQLNQALDQLPAAVRDLKTGGGSADLASPVGFLNSQVFYVTLPLIQIIMAIGLGGSLLAKDEENHTLELLLTRPVSRVRILAGKALAGVVGVLLAGLITAGVIAGLAGHFGLHIGTAHLFITQLGTTVFSLAFGAVAFALTAASSFTRRMAVALASLLAVASYLSATLSGLSHYIKTPAKFLPYHYFNPADLLVGHYSLGFTLYIFGIFVGASLVAWLGFRRRDIA